MRAAVAVPQCVPGLVVVPFDFVLQLLWVLCIYQSQELLRLITGLLNRP